MKRLFILLFMIVNCICSTNAIRVVFNTTNNSKKVRITVDTNSKTMIHTILDNGNTTYVKLTKIEQSINEGVMLIVAPGDLIINKTDTIKYVLIDKRMYFGNIYTPSRIAYRCDGFTNSWYQFDSIDEKDFDANLDRLYSVAEKSSTNRDNNQTKKVKTSTSQNNSSRNNTLSNKSTSSSQSNSVSTRRRELPVKLSGIPGMKLEDAETGTYFVRISATKFRYGVNVQTKTGKWLKDTILKNYEIEIYGDSDGDWIQVSKKNSTSMILDVEANYGSNSRNGFVAIKVGGKRAGTIWIQQLRDE